MSPISNFNTAFEFVIGIEKGFVNNPADHGGPTKFGITARTLASWRGNAEATAEEVAALDEAEAKAIYFNRYWLPMQLDQLSSAKVATFLFDQGVNAGPKVAVKALQTALEALAPSGLGVDGTLGPDTAQKANAAAEEALIRHLTVEAQRHYLAIWRADPTQGVFLAGWIARTWHLLLSP